MTQEEYLLLYQRYLSGIATRAEIKLLFSYKDKFDIGKFDDGTSIPDQELIKQRIYAQIEKRIADSRRARRSVHWLWWSAAASVLLITFAAQYFTHKRSVNPQNSVARIIKSVAPITPGTNKAILILGNGSKVDLNQTANGRIGQAGKTLIDKVKNGQLVYGKNDAKNDKPTDITYNTIITPRGGQYQVELPDGTMVWLDAASSLKYPTAFTGNERHVELTGEAYFEVAKNKNMPFTVSAGKINVKVLGTHFNISDYDDDPSSKTTLLEGSVQLTRDNQTVLLVPGQQAVSDNAGGKIQLKEVDVNDAVAWKNGYFSFRKENIQSAMRRIARWYDVDVAFQGGVSDKFLGGSVSRTQNIDEILSYLELTGIAHFQIKERRIIVKRY